MGIEEKNNGTTTVGIEKDRELLYQERINFLMTQTGNQAGGIYIDVTEDKILAITTEEDMLNEDQIENSSMSAWMKKYIHPNLVFMDELDEFREIFRRTELLRRYEEGLLKFQYYYYFKHKKEFKFYRIDIKMHQNRRNSHVEALMIWTDVTQRYIDTEVRRILYKNDFEAVALIDLRKHRIFFRSCNFKETRFPENKRLFYEDVVEKLAEERVAEQDKKYFLNCTSFESLEEKLRLTGEFSFQAYNMENRVERYTYHWFDKRRDVLLVVIEDMTDEFETDSVTGARNRTGFAHKAEEILKQNQNGSYAVLYFNIQRFKALNDLFGYEAGDEVLCQWGDFLRNSFLRPSVIGRIEADHFALLVETKYLDLKRIPELTHRVYYRKNSKVDVYGRCGIYYIQDNNERSITDMCDKAKLAKLQISNQYVQPYCVFNEEMKKDYEKWSMALIQLDDAIKNQEIKVYYHPIYDAKTRKIVFAEALARWESPKNGMILPGNFIPPLEESGHITKLDAFIYGAVQSFLERREMEGKKILPVTVNLSRMDLMDEEIMFEIRRNVNDSRLSKEKICFEITESAYAMITEEGVEFLSKLHEYGVKLLVDDFGSGVSSFSTIRDYEFDVMKLDMGFVRKLGVDKKNNNILLSLVELAHRLNMKVVAEGVETKEQAEFLQGYGCDYLQGFYFSRPMPEAQFEQLLEQ